MVGFGKKKKLSVKTSVKFRISFLGEFKRKVIMKKFDQSFFFFLTKSTIRVSDGKFYLFR